MPVASYVSSSNEHVLDHLLKRHAVDLLEQWQEALHLLLKDTNVDDAAVAHFEGLAATDLHIDTVMPLTRCTRRCTTCLTSSLNSSGTTPTSDLAFAAIARMVVEALAGQGVSDGSSLP